MHLYGEIIMKNLFAKRYITLKDFLSCGFYFWPISFLIGDHMDSNHHSLQHVWPWQTSFENKINCGIAGSIKGILPLSNSTIIFAGNRHITWTFITDYMERYWCSYPNGVECTVTLKQNKSFVKWPVFFQFTGTF